LTKGLTRKRWGMSDSVRLWNVWLGRAIPSTPPMTVSTQNAASTFMIDLAGKVCLGLL